MSTSLKLKLRSIARTAHTPQQGPHQMRRAIVGLAATAFTALALAAPASAAKAQVTRIRFSGSFAEASWATTSATSSTYTDVAVSKSRQGSELGVYQATGHFHANGNFTGATVTTADVTSGFSFALRQPLASASLSASGVPAQTCKLDADFDQLIDCSAATIDVSVAWAGQGPITRGVENDHFKTDGFHVTDHFYGTDRNATATGTVAGLALTASDPQEADLGTTKSGTTTVCIGNNC